MTNYVKTTLLGGNLNPRITLEVTINYDLNTITQSRNMVNPNGNVECTAELHLLTFAGSEALTQVTEDSRFEIDDLVLRTGNGSEILVNDESEEGVEFHSKTLTRKQILKQLGQHLLLTKAEPIAEYQASRLTTNSGEYNIHELIDDGIFYVRYPLWNTLCNGPVSEIRPAIAKVQQELNDAIHAAIIDRYGTMEDYAMAAYLYLLGDKSVVKRDRRALKRSKTRNLHSNIKVHLDRVYWMKVGDTDEDFDWYVPVRKEKAQ